MLGTHVDDPLGVEGASSTKSESAPMLGLLPLRTVMEHDKLTTKVTVDFDHESGASAAYSGYEIRNGVVFGADDLVVATSPAGPVAWRRDNITATTVHGLFEHPTFVDAVLGVTPVDVLAGTFEALADAVEAHLATDLLWKLTR